MDPPAAGVSWAGLLLETIPRLLARAAPDDYHFLSGLSQIPSSSIVHDHPEIGIVLDGLVRMDTSDKPHHLGQGAVVVIAPHMYHLPVASTESSDILWSGVPAGHAGLGVVRHFRDSGFSVMTGTDLFGENRLREIVDKVQEELTARPAGWHPYCRSLLTEFFVLAYRTIGAPADREGMGSAMTSRADNIVEKVRLFLERHYAHHLSLPDVAHHVALSPNYLANLFKHRTDTTIMAYLADIRIREAQRLLTHTDRTISEIAYEVGYKSPFHFSRQFKAETTMSPRDYRGTYSR